MARSILIVRLGALGDLVHALPAVAALRQAWPDARIDWLVDARYRALLDFVPVVNRTFVIGRGQPSPLATIGSLRRERYDLAIDLQGLMKSAAMARLSGARQVVGFATPFLRERLASVFYNVHAETDGSGHVIAKNLSVLRQFGIQAGDDWKFPLVPPPASVVDDVKARLGLGEGGRFAIINPGAGWPNKQWPAVRFGQIAGHIAERHGLRSAVLWGPGEQAIADTVAAASSGAAMGAPPTDLGEMLSLIRASALFVAGDTGPLQVAAAFGVPVVGLFGPTNPARNGPWSRADVTISRFDQCECHHKRQCRRRTACIEDIEVGEVRDAVDRRLKQVTIVG